MWVVVGSDFNVVRFPSERKGGGGFTRAMEDFSDFIERIFSRSSTNWKAVYLV